MDENRHSQLTIAFVSLMLPATLLVAYVAGYFWFGKRDDWWLFNSGGYTFISESPSPQASPFTCRTFENQWLATTYKPLASLESKLRGVTATTQTTALVPEKEE